MNQTLDWMLKRNFISNDIFLICFLIKVFQSSSRLSDDQLFILIIFPLIFGWN